MIKTVSFTHVEFMSVVRISNKEDLPDLLDEFTKAGFVIKEEDNVKSNEDIRILYRHILFSKEDIQKDILAMEKTIVERLLAKRPHLQGEWLTTFIQSKEVFNIPKQDVQYNGRTVCLQIYPDLQAYVE